MSVIARKAILVPPHGCGTVEPWTCLACSKPFAVITIDTAPEETSPLVPTNEIPKFCPHCGAKFDRWVP
jgi:hypothetical protein